MYGAILFGEAGYGTVTTIIPGTAITGLPGGVSTLTINPQTVRDFATVINTTPVVT